MSNTGGPAFPSGENYLSVDRINGQQTKNSKSPLHKGMALRDYFAANAMQSFISNSDGFINQEITNKYAKMAYAMADAMLAEKAKGEK